MELGTVVLLIGLVAFWLYARKEKAVARDASELDTWSLDLSEDPYAEEIEVNFPAMLLRREFYTTDGPGVDSVELRHVRRSIAGKWEGQLTIESWNDERDERVARASLKLPFALSVEELGTHPVWLELPDRWVAPLETAYQRYLLHSKVGQPRSTGVAAAWAREVENRRIRKIQANAQAPMRTHSPTRPLSATSIPGLAVCRACQSMNQAEWASCQNCGGALR